jgi:hypothetical protein
MAASSRKIISKSGTIEFTQKAKRIALDRLKRMQGVEKGEGKFEFSDKTGKPLMLICFDHQDIDELRYLHWLYVFDSKEKEYVVQNTKVFENLFLKISQSIWHYGINENKKLDALKEPIGWILEELFKNTHDWARTGFGADAKNPLKSNMRGIFAEIHHGTREHFQNTSRGSKPLENYFNHPQFFDSSDENAKFSFLELSILDSGPGYSQKWSKIKITDEKPIDLEFNDIIDCLAKHNTSDTSSISRLRGLGLHEVAFLCGGRGFLKIRTGRLSVYRDFVLDPYSVNNEDVKTMKSYIKDWATCNSTLTRFHFAEGSLLTIFYPLEKEQLKLKLQ